MRTACRSPWLNGYVEPVIRTLPRECLNHIVPPTELHLLTVLPEFVVHYNEVRTHQSLDGNAPIPSWGEWQAATTNSNRCESVSLPGHRLVECAKRGT
jgi:transposase InsO family protein